MAIRQMREQHLLSIRTNVIANMTVNADLPRRHIADRQLLIWIAEQDDRVDEVSGIGVGGQELGGIVYDLAALAVAGDAEFGRGALGQCLFDELGRC
jgi:hypothetical protein